MNDYCHEGKCERFQIIEPLGPGCVKTMPPDSQWENEWTPIDKLKNCQGFIPKLNSKVA